MFESIERVKDRLKYGKYPRIQCEKRLGALLPVIKGSWDAADKVVAERGLPIHPRQQAHALAETMQEIALEESGLGATACANCVKKPEECLREVTTDPRTMDYDALAERVLTGLEDGTIITVQQRRYNEQIQREYGPVIQAMREQEA